MNRSSHLGRIGDRYAVDATLELVVPSAKRRFKKQPGVFETKVKNLSVSGALLAVATAAGLVPKQMVTVRYADLSVSMRIVRVAPGDEPDVSLVAIGSPPNDTQWGTLVGLLVGGPDAPDGLRWLGGVG